MSDRKLFLIALFVLVVAPLYAYCKLAGAEEVGCSASAQLLRYACSFDARDSRHIGRAQCEDASLVDAACLDEVEDEFEEALEECGSVLVARLEVCDGLGDASHDPSFGHDFVAEFVDPTHIGAGIEPNPYFPLVAGNTWIYEGDGETITVSVTTRTKHIDGITCVVVNDVVVDEDGVTVEDTDDWYAQDVAGNVWYCGEIAENYELFDGDEPPIAELVDIEGSWKHGREGAKAGMLLPSEPTVGDVIRQEVSYTDAEDVVEILSVTASESAPGGSCTGNCLETRDFTPLEPGVEEHKFYAPGIGLIVEIDVEEESRIELVGFTGVGS